MLSPLFTDFYQLTMAQGYFSSGRPGHPVVFELFFRKVPQEGGYCLAAGLETALDYLENLRFAPEEIDYLKSLKQFSDGFLDYLRDFRFRASVDAVAEGTVVQPQQPLLRVRGGLLEAQLVESALLNLLNFQTLIATKAARVSTAAAGRQVLEFGMRRAQGPDGALSASRAAFIGGCTATSNALAGKEFNIPVRGTQAHSWVMSFGDELEAFRAYAKAYPDSALLLVDTYDTLGSGVPNAIQVARELAEQGHRLAGIRLDSGDLAVLSRGARAMLDEAGFADVKIAASNDLDEYLVESLLLQGAPIDVWGVGTQLVTSRQDPALGGVYKLVAIREGEGWRACMKLSSQPAKSTHPAPKQVYRAWQGDRIAGDVICLEAEAAPSGSIELRDPLYVGSGRLLRADRFEPLLQPVMQEGRRIAPSPPLLQVQEHARAQLKALPPECLRLQNPALYPQGISPALFELRTQLQQKLTHGA